MTPTESARSLAEVLRSLHTMRRIVNPWPPGMQIRGHLAIGRVVASNKHGIQLLEWVGWDSRKTYAHDQVPSSFEPDLSDPATRGCLLELLREASGKPSMLLVPHREEGEEPITEWTVEHLSDHVDWDDLDHFQPQPPYIVNAPTEGEAIAAALVAIVETL